MILRKYVDKLPIPKVIKPVEKRDSMPYYEVTMEEFEQKLHRDLPPTKVWGYAGSYPGPTIEVMKDKPILVKWINKLPINQHLLPVDTTVHGAELENPRVRTVVHLHGGNVPAESDGYPEAWFTNAFMHVGPKFTTEVYCYPNIQPAANLWYHDHALGITRLNVYAGLAGLYLIRDIDEKNLRLPNGIYEIPLIIQDRSFNEDGSLFYPSEPEQPVQDVYPSIVPEFFGDTILVNGKVWPYLDVEPRLYRFRIVNGSNSRFYSLCLSSGQGKPLPMWYQIGTDQGFLEKPELVTKLLLAPGERADILIDFSGLSGQEYILTNDAPAPFPGGEAPNPKTTGQIIKFIVGQDISEYINNIMPYKLTNIEKPHPYGINKTRDLTLSESTDKYGRPILLLNSRLWDDPVTEKPRFRSTEIWRLINLTVDTHPIHLHLVRFQVIDRQPFDVEIYNQTGDIITTGPAVPPVPIEMGWKDTVRSDPGNITRIIVHFVDFAGVYPLHCHILEHEDHDMMRPYKVVKKLGK